MEEQEKWIKHYSSKQEILLVGEGDFSFAACLAKTFGNACNMIATSLDTECQHKYMEGMMIPIDIGMTIPNGMVIPTKKTYQTKEWNEGRNHHSIPTSIPSYQSPPKYLSGAAANLDLLKEKGCNIMHNVDARTMRHHHTLSHKKFDRIVYNFPHAGFVGPEHNSYQISLHQDVVRCFLENAYEMVRETGEVHITHKTAHPFCKWEIDRLAQEAGFVLRDSPSFYIWEYPGYTNRKGSGLYSSQSFPVGDCRTYKFVKP